jgi:AraC-like DNA-binding protein
MVLPKGEVKREGIIYTQLIFITEGSITVYKKNSKEVFVDANQFFLVSAMENIHYWVNEDDTKILVLFLYSKLNFCSHFPLEYLNREKLASLSKETYTLLTLNERLASYLKGFLRIWEDGLRCSYLIDIKTKEILFYLRAYYPKEDLMRFFSPILNNDSHFSEIIFANIDNIRTVLDVANLTGYSVSGVKKKFKKVFNVSVIQWINKTKSKKIYQEICCGTRTFKEIADDYNFTSPSHFDKFCKRMFGSSPGTIKKMNIDRCVNNR